MPLYGLIGYPLGHSFSKKYFTNKFEKENLEDCFFELFPLENILEFPSLIDAYPTLHGLAVTIPYKESVIPFLDHLNYKARQIGAVNCITIRSGVLTGYNTDVIGFEKSFTPLLQPQHTKALVLGTGGASKAVQYVLKALKLPFKIVSRVADNRSDIIAYTDLTNQLIQEYPIIINCSPVGMGNLQEAKPALPYQYLTPGHYLYDLIYQPEETLFLQEGKLKGATIKNGYEMLVLQAEENWKIWNDNSAL
jgi:shikimate dehydrogenase